jgi:tryptophan synthase alpha chain
MRRIEAAFRSAKRAGRAAFIPYITAGDPKLEATVDLIRGLRHAGADVIELGVPFSDPIADGPTNQRAAERALATGTNLSGVLAAVEVIRQDLEIPIVLFTYANPVVRYGIDRFAEDASSAGIDGVLFTDVPAEEMAPFEERLSASGLDLIMLVTPTSGRRRMKAAARFGGGFLYLVSRTGVTGARQDLDAELASNVRSARKASKLPVAVGFGISSPEQVARVASLADGVVVGSAIVSRIGALGACDELVDEIESFARTLSEACKK